MSRFSGKCDVYDWFCDMSDEHIASFNIYPHNSIVPLNIQSRKDLIPYYPYLVSGAIGKEIHLSSRSNVDVEEEDLLKIIRKNILKEYNRCKRKHEEFDPDATAHYMSTFDIFLPETLEIARRVAKDGSKATIDGIHRKIHEHYRNELLDEMVANGYSKSLSIWWIWKDAKLALEA